MRRLDMAFVGVLSSLSVFSLGCDPTINSSKIARTSVTVVNVIPFDDIKESLKPKFTTSGDNAKKEAIQTTSSQTTRELSSLSAELEAGIDVGSTGAAPTSPTNLPNKTTVPDSGAATSGSATDMSTIYSAANSLNQDVALLNQSLDNVAGLDDEKSAFVVRLSVCVLPETREQHFDVVEDLSFLPVKNPAGRIEVMPLLVTESYESIAQQQTSETLRSLALALSAKAGQAKLGGAITAIYDFVADLQSRQLNGLMDVSRIGNNSLRIRFGAVSAVGKDKTNLEYRTVPRDHKVSVLVLVPNTLIDEAKLKAMKENPGLHSFSLTEVLQVVTKTTYVDTNIENPKRVTAFTRDDAAEQIRILFKSNLDEAAFKSLDTPGDSWQKILAARENGNIQEFLNAIGGKDVKQLDQKINGFRSGPQPLLEINLPGSQESQAWPLAASKEHSEKESSWDSQYAFLWNEMTNILASQTVQTERVPLTIRDVQITGPIPAEPTLIDNGTTSTVKLSLLGQNLSTNILSVSLHMLRKTTKADVRLPASALVVSDEGKSLTVTFPSVQNETLDTTQEIKIDLVNSKIGTPYAPIKVNYLQAKAVNATAGISWKLNRGDLVRNVDGKAGPVAFSVELNAEQSPPSGLTASTLLQLKVSGASDVQILDGATAAALTASQTGIFPINLKKPYTMLLSGVDSHTPVVLQLLWVKDGNPDPKTQKWEPLGEAKSMAVGS